MAIMINGQLTDIPMDFPALTEAAKRSGFKSPTAVMTQEMYDALADKSALTTYLILSDEDYAAWLAEQT